MYLNLSAYGFIDLDNLPALRERIDASGRRHRLRGTVLLASEGLNLAISALPEDARAFLDEWADHPAFAGLDTKASDSDHVGYRRWKVRVRPEIISFRQPGVRPQDGRAACVSARDLRAWLRQGHDHEGRPVTLVDTRNRCEVDAGTFDHAIDLRLAAFTELPQALPALRERLRDHRVVTFCTGGIRCEKAALLMARQGFEHVVQLEGGVLRYFEEVGGAHWRGSLFVFDERGALTPGLRPTPAPMAIAAPAAVAAPKAVAAPIAVAAPMAEPIRARTTAS